ncbi:hypothetical protein BRC19_03920 [Candidatus Saccharibacteria bacterium QS_5_54_17]|nr:MAG: hypothetical protein BRC19_03920 [Candidatus Saccharibacteria bacterium QS_5_54_17]
MRAETEVDKNKDELANIPKPHIEQLDDITARHAGDQHLFWNLLYYGATSRYFDEIYGENAAYHKARFLQQTHRH